MEINKLKITKKNSINVATSCEWNTIDGGNLSAIKRKLKNDNLNKEVDSFFASVMSVNKKSPTSYTKSVVDKRLYNDNVIPLAAFFIFDFRSNVIIKRMKEYTENGVQHSLFWFCAIDTNGIILEDILLNEDYIDGKISEYSEMGYSISVYKNDYSPTVDNIIIDRTFDNDVFDIDEVDFDNLSFNIYKRENYRKYYQLGFLFTATIVSIGLFFNMYETEDRKNLLSENFTSGLSEERRQINNWSSIQDNKSNGGRASGNAIYTQEESDDLAKQKIQDIFNSRNYTNNNIINNIIDIERSMPNFLVEWRLGNIMFLDNEFIIMYNRISGSSGVFTELDMLLSRYDNYVPFEIVPLSLDAGATIRTLGIDFNNKIDRTRDQSTGLTLFELRERQINNVEDILRDINNLERNISRLQGSAENINTFEQVFTNKIERLRMEIQSDVSRLSNLYNEAIKEISIEFSGFELDFEINKSTFSNYIEIKHLNSIFEWSMPVFQNKFPNIEDIGVDYYAEAYSVEVSSIEDLSNNFDLMIDAAEQLTGLNSIIKEVEYNIISGEWKIKAYIYERK